MASVQQIKAGKTFSWFHSGTSWPCHEYIFDSYRVTKVDFSYVFVDMLKFKWLRSSVLVVVADSPVEITAPSSAPLLQHDFTTLPLLVLFCASDWGLLGFCTLLHILRWIRGQSIQVWRTIPLWKRVSPRVGSRERVVSPPWLLWKQRVTWKTQFSDVIPRRKMLGGALIYFCGSTEDLNSCLQLGSTLVAFIAQKSVPSYKFNFSLQWQTVKEKKQQKRKKIKVSLFACLPQMSCPKLPSMLPPKSFSTKPIKEKRTEEQRSNQQNKRYSSW